MNGTNVAKENTVLQGIIERGMVQNEHESSLLERLNYKLDELAGSIPQSQEKNPKEQYVPKSAVDCLEHINGVRAHHLTILEEILSRLSRVV